MRKTIFANNEYYHIYNRGVDKREVFLDLDDYERFLLGMDLLNDDVCGLMLAWRDSKRVYPKAKPLANQRLSLRRVPLVEIIAYCLNPNHYHLILKQKSEKGIEKFMQKIGTSYTMYFNKKSNRSGSLFQGPFKAIHIDSNEYLLYLSAYVNKNNFIHGYNKNDNWPYASLLDYIGKRDEKLCSKEIILDQFENEKDYKKFVDANAIYLKERKKEKKYLLEE